MQAVRFPKLFDALRIGPTIAGGTTACEQPTDPVASGAATGGHDHH